MKRLWLFNPENDIALAHGSANFTAPAAALSLRRAGELLPLWIAEAGDAVMCSGVNARWLDDVQQKFGIEVEPWDYTFGYRPTPWGWSRAVRHEFAMNGFAADSMPDDAWLEAHRRLSHRRTSILVAEQLAKPLDFQLWPAAVEVDCVAALEQILAAGGDYVVKSPWSSSGRGIAFSRNGRRENFLRQAEGTIRRQGSLLVEREARRLCDFAMLFDYAPGACRYLGLSLFAADERGAYTGNVVARQSELSARLQQYINAESLDTVAEALSAALQEVLGEDYAGPVGVDMLIAATPNGPILDPVVEVNLRWTMGFVALRLARLVDAPAKFSIAKGDLTTTCHHTVVDGKLQSGSLALTPAGSDFTFLLSV